MVCGVDSSSLAGHDNIIKKQNEECQGKSRTLLY